MKHPPRNIVIDWLNTIWSTQLESNSKLVACNLRRYMNAQNDMAWPSVGRIAGECGLSENCVRKHIKILVSEGWLVAQGKSGLETNIYQAAYPPAIIAPATIEPLQPVSLPPATIAPKLNKELNNTLSKGFKRPSIQEVADYCSEKGYTIDPETFINYYNSNGWKVGRSSMKCWKSACTNWNKREKQNGHKQGGKQYQGRKTAAGAAQALRESIARDEAAMASHD